jgi:hypothetical protein
MSTMAQLVTISYIDLQSFDPEKPEAAPLMEQIGQAFGPTGLGILAVSGVPNFNAHRQALLPLAAKLPYLPDLETCVDAASLYSVGWSHGKEELAPGKPDTAKGSFYANPLTNDLAAALTQRDGASTARQALAAAHPEFFAPNLWLSQSLPELQMAFTRMGQLLHGVGCLVATVCDAYCCQQRHVGGVPTKIATTLQRSLNAKGRLLHYFALDDDDGASNSPVRQPWCGWHNDHVRTYCSGLVVAVVVCAAAPHCTSPFP